MVLINSTTMQATVKIVYYGPGLCGKTTNLLHIHQKTAPRSRGEMISLETESDRTLFFDLLPLEVGVVQGMRVRLQLYTVPGQVFYNATRQLVLRGADGVVFVADSQEVARDANIEALRNLGQNLAELGMRGDEIPLVFQYNKRDLKQILPVEELQRELNPKGLPWFEGAALHGLGVFETLKGITRAALTDLRRRADEDARARASRAPAAPAAPAPPVVHPWVEGRPIASAAAPAAGPLQDGPLETTPVEFAEETTGDRALRAVAMKASGEISERLEQLRSAAGAMSGYVAVPPAAPGERAPSPQPASFEKSYVLARRARVRVPSRVLESASDIAVHLSFGRDVVVMDVVVGRLVRDPETGRLLLHLDLEIEEQK